MPPKKERVQKREVNDHWTGPKIGQWLKDLFLPKQDIEWIETVFEQLRKKNRRGNKVGMRLADAVMLNICDWIRTEICEFDAGKYDHHRYTREERDERVALMQEALREVQEAHRAVRRAFNRYYEITPPGKDLHDSLKAKGVNR